MKRFLGFLGLILLCALCLCPATGCAADSDYVVRGGKIVGYTGTETHLVVPAVIAGQTVTGVDGAFKGNATLQTVALPDTVTSIGWGSFEKCTALRSVDAPGVETIAGLAFYQCAALQSVSMPKVETIALWSFCQSGLTSVALPDTLTSIGDNAFYGTKLTSVVIPPLVDKIPARCFAECASLASVSLPDSLTSLGTHCFEKCTALTSVVVPPLIDTLPAHCFDSCLRLRYIDLGQVETLGRAALNYCVSLGSLTLPDTLTTIDNEALAGGIGVHTLFVPESVTSIAGSAFRRDMLLHVVEGSYAHAFAVDQRLAYTFDGVTPETTATVLRKEVAAWLVSRLIDDSMSDYDKVKTLYDWICLNTHYDYVWLDELEKSRRPVSRDTLMHPDETVLLDGAAVCGRYASDFKLLLDCCGIPCIGVSSAAINHAWNLVQLGGEWYQFDATWDAGEPAPQYRYFGLSDAAMDADHAHQETSMLACNAIDYNYFYRNGDYDEAIAALAAGIEERYAAGERSFLLAAPNGLNATDCHTIAIALSGHTDYSFAAAVQVVYLADGNSFCVAIGEGQIATESLALKRVDANNTLIAAYWMKPGDAYTLRAVRTPANANDEITWTSTNESVLTVSANGVVTARNAGTAEVRACCGSLRACARIRVSAARPDENVYYSGTATKIGDTLEPQCQLYPALGSTIALKWECTNAEQFAVNATTGVLRLKALKSNWCARLTVTEGTAREFSVFAWVYSTAYKLSPRKKVLTLAQGESGVVRFDDTEALLRDGVELHVNYFNSMLDFKTSTIVRASMDAAAVKLTVKALKPGLQWLFISPDIIDSGYQFAENAERPSCFVLAIVHDPSAVTLPAGTLTIGARAFERTAVRELVAPDGLASIGDRAFADCASLRCVYLPDSVTQIADNAFEGSAPLICCTAGSYAARYAALHGIEAFHMDVEPRLITY